MLELVVGLALLTAALGIVVFNEEPRSTAQPPRTPAGVDGFHIGVDGEPVSSADLNEAAHRLRIPRFGVDAPIVAVEDDDDGELGVPKDPAVVGWWSDGPVPGIEPGTSILVGHANSAKYGPGALAVLESVEPGDKVVVRGWDRVTTFRVEEIKRYSKAALPANEAFRQDIDGRLAIVSCTDLDEATGTYLENIIVYAVPTGHRDVPSAGGQSAAGATG